MKFDVSPLPGPGPFEYLGTTTGTILAGREPPGAATERDHER